METNKETISKLKFIGKIQNGDLITRSMEIQNDSYLTKLYRTIFQESRQKTLAFIEETITKSFEILKCYEKSKRKSEKLMCSYLMEDLKNSKSGLLNIKKTYEKDIKFCCDIDTLLQMIEAKLTETEITLPPPPIDREYSSDEAGDEM